MYVPGPLEKDQSRVNAAIRQLASGRSNATGTVTLTPSATTTTVNAVNCSAESIPFISPMSASAATAGAYILGVAKGQFIIGHSSSTAIDRTFGWACLG